MATGSPSHKRIEIPKKSDIVYEGYAKFKSKTKGKKYQERYLTLIRGLPKQPILLVFSNSDKQKQELGMKVHGVSAKDKDDDIRVDDKGNQIFIHATASREHIKWIAVLKSSITDSVHIPVKHCSPDGDEIYSLLHVEGRTYPDNTKHDMIILSSPYDDKEHRHCWDSLVVKQLRAVQEGILIEFCQHCCKSDDLVQLGFTLRLPQKDVENCLEFFCQHTTAKYKQDAKYICEMKTHSLLCPHAPPVREAPRPPSAPSGVSLVLYNVSNKLFGSSLDTKSGTPILPPRQKEPRNLQYVNQDSDNQPSTTTQKISLQDELSSQSQMQGSHVRNRPPIVPRKSLPACQQQSRIQQETVIKLARQKSWPKQKPTARPRRVLVKHIYDEIDDPPGLQYDTVDHTGVYQSNSTPEVNICGIKELHANQDTQADTLVDQNSVLKETAHSQPSIPTAVVKELKTSITPDVISIPLTDKRASPLSVSVYRKQVMNTMLSYSDDDISATLPAQRAALVSNKKFAEIHNKLKRVSFKGANDQKEIYDDTILSGEQLPHNKTCQPTLQQSRSALESNVDTINQKEVYNDTILEQSGDNGTCHPTLQQLHNGSKGNGDATYLKETYNVSLEQQLPHTSTQHSRLVQSNSAPESYKRVTTAKKKASTNPFKKGPAPQPPPRVKARTFSHPTTTNSNLQESSVFNNPMTGQTQIGVEEKQAAMDLPVTKDTSPTGRKQPTTIDEEFSHCGFSTFL